MLVHEKKKVASLLSAVMHVEKKLQQRDTHGPEESLFRECDFILKSAREECERELKITSFDR